MSGGGLATAGGLVVALGLTCASYASWSTSGSGVGTATVDTLPAPTGVAASSVGSTVNLTWAGSTPPEGTLDGYVVTRHDGLASSSACGTDPANPGTFIPPGTLTCADTVVADGSYTYSVTARFRTWTAQSAVSDPVSVEAPSQVVTLASGAGSASMTSTTLYYRPTVAGSFRLEDSVTSVQAGPASATFPEVGAAGWTHPAETVSSGAGGPSTTTYLSSVYSWSPSPAQPGPHPVVGHDGRGATVTTALSIVPDALGPTGGVLTVNGTAANGSEPTSHAKASFAIGVRTDYAADAGSGVASSVLTSESATLTNGACGTFGSPTVIVGAPAQTGLTTGCYRYTLTGTDAVGNTSVISTIVRYDTGAPTQNVTLVSGVNAAQTGTVVYFRSAAGGSFALTNALTDTASGPASTTFPIVSTSGWTHAAETDSVGTASVPTSTYSSGAYTFGAGASTPTTHSVVGSDLATNTVITGLTFSADNTSPTGGALTVNAVVASGAAPTSSNKTGSFTIGTRTDYTDAASGIASSTLTVASATLTNNACGSFGATSVIVGSPAQSGLTTGCHRYTLTGTDRVGNSVAISTIVKVDIDPPTDGAVTINGTAADAAGTSSYAKAAFPIDSRTDWTDAESGIATSLLTRAVASLSGGTCGAFTGSTSITGTTTQTGLTTNCYRYTLTGTDNATNTNTVTTIVMYDTAAPTGGALTVNSLAANTTGGSTSFNKTGSFTIGTRTDYTDTASGLESSTLTVASATLTNNICASFGATSVIVGSPAQSGLTTGCYRYTLTGTDKAGNSAVPLVTTVKVDLELPTDGAVTVNGTAADAAGTSSYAKAAFPIDSRTDWTDAESGLVSPSTLTRASATLTGGGTCGAFGATTPQVGTPSQTGLTTNCYRYVLTGTDNATNTNSVTTIVRYDTAVPTGGVLNVNGLAATGAGNTSNANKSSYAITRTDYTDAASGLASSTLTRAMAPLTGTTCGTFGSPTTLIGNPTQTGLDTGCYLYTLTGTDNAGNTASVSTTVKLGVYVSDVTTVNGTGTAGLVDQGDRIVVTFSESIEVGTLCSAWSGNGSDQAINGDNQATVSLNNAGNDTITVTSSVCTFRFGTLNLGSGNYTTTTRTFGGAGTAKSTITWTASTRQLTITLGAVSGAGAGAVASSAVILTPSTLVTNPNSVAVGGTFTTANVQQF